jgi:hypothetical protein
MVRIAGKAFWLLVPALADGLIGGEPVRRFEPLREIIGLQKSVQMGLQMGVSLVVLFVHGGFFERAVHAFHMPVGPAMVGFGQPLVASILLADAVKALEECGSIARPVSVKMVWSLSGTAAIRWRRNGAATVLLASGCSSA